MPTASFRLVAGGSVPGGDRCKQAFLATLAAFLAAGCGSGGHTAERVVAGTGYTFDAPSSWEVVRTARQVQVADRGHSLTLVAVSRFPLLHTFRPDAWTKVTRELDRAADGIAEQLQRGSVTDTRDVTISSVRARRYKIAYALRGKKFIEELAFVLRGKTEYLLLCRYEQSKPSASCDRLLETFTLT